MKINAEFWTGLDDNEKEILLQSAMITPPVSLDILFSTLSCAPTKLLKALDKFQALKILEPCRPRGIGFYSFSSRAYSSCILSQASEEQIVANATKLVDYFHDSVIDSPDAWIQIAQIYHIAKIPVRHASTLIKAAEHCMENNNLKEAFVYFHLVISSFPPHPESPEEKLLYVKAAVGLCANSEDFLPIATQEQITTRALSYVGDLNEVNLHVRTLFFKARSLMRQGKFNDADGLYADAMEIAANSSDPSLKKWTSVFISDIEIWKGRIKDAISQYEELVGKLEELPANAFLLKACSRLGWSYGICGEFYRGLGLVNVVQKKAIDLRIRYIEIYSELMKLMILTDTRRIEEAEASLEIILGYPESELDHYVLWAAYGKKAYFSYLKDDLKQAYASYQKAIIHSNALGCPHFHGTDHLEYLHAFEKAGLEEDVLQKKLEAFLNWPDIYTQGAALRYRAMYAMAENHGQSSVRDDLEKSIELLSLAGAKVELAQTQVLMARLLLSENREESRVRSLLKEAWDTFSKVNSDLFPDSLKQYVQEDDSETLLVDAIVEMGNTLSQTRNRFDLLSEVVQVVIRLVGAERGGILLLDDGGRITLESSRNLDSQTVLQPGFKTSFDIIQRVINTGKESISFGKFASLAITGRISERGWIVCHPIILRNEILGSLYLDNSFSAARLPVHKLMLVKAIANQIAVGLDIVDAYDKIAKLSYRLEAETQFYRKEREKPAWANRIVGESPGIKKILATIREVAPSDATVLIYGETGVGKELVAKAIHALSNRSDGPFIPINVAAISPDLVYSELFGHVKGSFTGAIQDHMGRFELANTGTFFMDDVDGLSLDVQVKLLRVLEEREFQKVGSTRTTKSDFRLIAATNSDLKSLVQQGKFRSDFYYRLSVVPLRIPPLRDRKEDIPLLAKHFLDVFSKKTGKPITRISPDNIERLTQYPWPGNVRELAHYIERAVILTQGNRLKLPKHDPVASELSLENDFPGLNALIRNHIIHALTRCNWKVSGPDGAAALLKMNPQTLYSKIGKMGIKKP